MEMNTKLVKCGGHIEIFDYECPVKHKKFIYERQATVRIPRHIRVNFRESGNLSYAKLIIDSTNCEDIRENLHIWFKYFTAPILAAIQPFESESHVYILHRSLKKLLKHNPFNNMVSYEIITANALEVTTVFINAFEEAVGDNLRNAKKFLIEHNLKEPEILWNKHAEAFIKRYNLVNRIPYKTLELWDRGWYSYNCYQL